MLEMADATQRRLKKNPAPVARPGALYTFFPAKPGVGTSTVSAEHQLRGSRMNWASHPVLDCDLAAGVIHYHLKLGNTGSILDALRHSSESGRRSVAPNGGKARAKADVMHRRAVWNALHLPIRIACSFYARRVHYEVVIADLGQ